MRIHHVILAYAGCIHTALSVDPPGYINIDFAKSCSAKHSPHLLPNVTSAFHSAIRWSLQAVKQLDQDPGSRGEGNDAYRERINEKIQWLIGTNDKEDPRFQNFRSYFNEISKFKIVEHVDETKDLWSRNWENIRSYRDVEVFCHWNHIIHVEPEDVYRTVVTPKVDKYGYRVETSKKSYWYWDKRRYEFLDDDDMNVKQKTEHQPAITKTSQAQSQHTVPYGAVPGWGPRPDTITFYRAWLKKQQANKANTLYRDKIEQVAKNTWAQRFTDTLKNGFETLGYLFMNPFVPYVVGPVDRLAKVDRAALMQLTVTTSVTRDVAGNPAGFFFMGWRNCVKKRQGNNADTIAWFGFAVELILRYGYDIDLKGRVVKIPSVSTDSTSGS